MNNCNFSTQSRETFIQFHTFVNGETVVRVTHLVNALHTKTHAVRAVRSVTGMLAAEKLERNNVQEVAVENAKSQFPATKLDMADQRTDVHQVLIERTMGYIQSILNARQMASLKKKSFTPSLSSLNVLTPLTKGLQHGMKHSRCSMYNHPDSRETDTHFG